MVELRDDFKFLISVLQYKAANQMSVEVAIMPLKTITPIKKSIIVDDHWMCAFNAIKNNIV